MSSRSSSDQGTPPPDGRWSFWRRFLWGSSLGAAVVLVVALCVGHARGFFGVVFWQQFTTTFVGASLALVSTLWLYRWQERSLVHAKHRAESRQEATRLNIILLEIQANDGSVPSIRSAVASEGLQVHERMRTLVAEPCLVALLQESEPLGMYTEIGVLLDLYGRLNRALDAYCRYPFADTYVREPLRSQLARAIVQQLTDIERQSSDLAPHLIGRLQHLEQEA